MTKNAQYLKTWKERNRDKYLAGKKDYYQRNKEREYERGWKNQIAKLGVTPEDYWAMFEAQMGLCAICKRASERRLAVDHCHATGRVRGLLCRTCNVGLGSFKDDRAALREAIRYLESA